jgi:hypothetical protein
MAVVMQHELFSSIDEMLSPQVLSQLSRVCIQHVRCLPFASGDSFSGNHFVAVETNGGSGPRYLVKYMNLSWDWLMAATNDHLCRSVTLWRTGLLDRLKPHIEHAIVGCAQDGDGWALLMREVTDGITVEFQPLSAARHTGFLEAMATVHATFWEAPELTDPALGLCTLPGIFDGLSVQTAARLPSSTSPIPRGILQGWPRLLTLVEPDVADVLRRLMEDPHPFCAAYDRLPWTLVHGDWRQGNIGAGDAQAAQVVALDWQLAGMGPATVDLAYYLANVEGMVPVSYEESVEQYRLHLARRLGARFDQSWWQPMLELGQLGYALRMGFSFAYDGIEDGPEAAVVAAGIVVKRFNQQVRAGLRWL